MDANCVNPQNSRLQSMSKCAQDLIERRRDADLFLVGAAEKARGELRRTPGIGDGLALTKAFTQLNVGEVAPKRGFGQRGGMQMKDAGEVMFL